jgi:thiamine monophosphate kinase
LDFDLEMTESQNKELDAFLAYFSTFNLHRDVSSAADLSDGLLEILSTMCDNLELAMASDL